jgi:hypothetical protein
MLKVRWFGMLACPILRAPLSPVTTFYCSQQALAVDEPHLHLWLLKIVIKQHAKPLPTSLSLSSATGTRSSPETPAQS